MDISFSSGCKKPRARTVLCTKALGDGHTFIADREEHPSNECGNGSQCAIDDEDVAQEIHMHLQSIDRYIKAADIMLFLDKPEVLRRLKRKKMITKRTSRNWLKRMGFCWTKDQKGQYVDGHEQPDVITYRQNVFLPAWSELKLKTQK